MGPVVAPGGQVSDPSVNVYSRYVMRLERFYEGVGFRETCRTPKEGEPAHAEVALDGFTLGLRRWTRQSPTMT